MKRVPTILEYIYRQRIKRAGGNLTYKQAFIRSVQYAIFNEETPILAHFVPCKDGMPMDKPTHIGVSNSYYLARIKEFQEAGKTVRWEGWKLSSAYKDEKLPIIRNGIRRLELFKYKTYGSIITSNIPLEPKREFGETLKLK